MTAWNVHIKGYLPDDKITAVPSGNEPGATAHLFDFSDLHPEIEKFVNSLLGKGHQQIRVELNGFTIVDTPAPPPPIEPQPEPVTSIHLA